MKERLSDLGFSKGRLAGAAFIFLTTAVSFYGLLYMMRESIRCLSVTVDYDIWILSSSEVLFYNTIYAAIAIVIAIGAALSFLINEPRFLNRSQLKKTSLLNDLRVLNWVFIAWVSKLGLCMGLFFVAAQTYYDFSFYPTYNYMFVLFVVVLYLQLWTNIRRIFSFNLLKIFVPITFIFVVGSLLLGNVNFIDYKKLNERTLSKSVYHNYRIEKPSSDSWTYKRNYRMTNELFLCFDKSDVNSERPLVIFEGDIIALEDIDSLLQQELKYFPEIQRHLFQVQLNIDKSVKMRDVNKLRNQIFKANIDKIAYAVVPEGVGGDQRLYKHRLIPALLTDFDAIDSLYSDEILKMNSVTVGYANNQVTLDGLEIPDSTILQRIRDIVEDQSNYLFQLNYVDDLNFDAYIKMYSIIREGILNSREAYSQKNHLKNYEYNDRAVRREIDKIFPMNIEDRF